MTTVRAEACCAPPFDDDDVDRIADALPMSAALSFDAHGGPVTAQFDVTEKAPLEPAPLAGAREFYDALLAAGFAPRSISCEIIDDPDEAP